MPADLDLVFKALADPTRRLLLDRLFDDNGQTLGALCEHLAMSRQAVTKHLDLLEAANLVVTVRRGREKLHYLNPEPIEMIAERWIGKYERRRVQALLDIKRALDGQYDEQSDQQPGTPDQFARENDQEHHDG
jgi:DNA-binding transcriptional ArsR family regulator